jgi:hypothetical protein
MFEQHRQDLKGLFLKPDSQALPAQFSTSKVKLKDPEAHYLSGTCSIAHEVTFPLPMNIPLCRALSNPFYVGNISP